MDPDISPCDNFYQYACGGWEKRNSIPYCSTFSWSVIEELDHSSLKFFRGMLVGFLLRNIPVVATTWFVSTMLGECALIFTCSKNY